MFAISIDLRSTQRLAVILAGGLLGSALRTAAGAWISWDPAGWPAATLLVNITGATAAAFYLTRREISRSSARSLDFWAIGLLGSFTTFSALALETVQLLEAGRAASAIGYGAGSTILGLLGAWAGHAVGERR